MELFEHGTINVTAPAAVFTPDVLRWINEVAVPELQAEWAEHEREMAERERLRAEMAAAEERAEPKRVGLTTLDAKREVARIEREAAKRDRARRRRQPAYVRENFVPEKPPEGQTLEQYIFTETSGIAYAYMLDYGLPGIDEEAAGVLVREMCIEAGLATT